MNTLETPKMQFPSHVTAPCDNETIVSLHRDIINGSMDTNNILASGNIHYFVRDHYVDTASGTYGIESLIKNILRSHGAIFPAGVADTELRAIAIAGSMLTEEIIETVRETFGEDRYPDGTIKMYLSKFSKGIGKIKMSASEDKDRPCNKPRCKWFLAE